MRPFPLMLSGLLLALSMPQVCSAADKTTVLGWQERALIAPEGKEIQMELDPTTAKSSMAVHDLVAFQKNGEDWVRFGVQSFSGLLGTAADLTLERKVLRSEKSKNSFGSSQRQVIRFSMCIGSQVYNGELTLKVHEKGDSPIKLGRDAIANIGLIDASRSNTIKPQCN